MKRIAALGIGVGVVVAIATLFFVGRWAVDAFSEPYAAKAFALRTMDESGRGDYTLRLQEDFGGGVNGRGHRFIFRSPSKSRYDLWVKRDDSGKWVVSLINEGLPTWDSAEDSR